MTLHSLFAETALARQVDRALQHLKDHLTRTTEILPASRIPFDVD